MPSRTVLRSRTSPRSAPTWFRRYQVNLVRIVTAAVLLAMALFAGWGTRQWYLQARIEAVERYLAPAKERFSNQFNARWFSVLPVPNILEGDEPSIRTFLELEPTVEAIISNKNGYLWVRNGQQLVCNPETPLKPFYLDLVARLRESGGDFISPGEGKDPDFGWVLRTAVSAEARTCSEVLIGARASMGRARKGPFAHRPPEMVTNASADRPR